MSLFLGKDNANSSVLHITKGVTPEVSMKSGVLSNTIFHSDLPYLSILDYVELDYYVTYYNEGYSVGGAKAYTGMYTVFIPDAYRHYFNNNYFILLEIATNNSSSNYICINNRSHTAYNSRAAGSKFYIAGGYKAFRSNTGPVSIHLSERAQSSTCDASYPYLVIDNQDSLSTGGSILYKYPYLMYMDPPIKKVKMYVFNIANGVYIPTIAKSDHSIYLDKSSFIITSKGKEINLASCTGVKYVADSTTYMPSAFNIMNVFDSYFTDIYLKLDKFNFEKTNAIGWEFHSNSDRTYINKVTSKGVQSLVDTSSSTAFLNYAKNTSFTQSYSYYGPTNNIIKTHTSASNTKGFYVVYAEGTYVCNYVTLPVLPTYLLINPRVNSTIVIASSSIGVTNYQGGVSWADLQIRVVITANSNFTITAAITFSGNPYPMSGTVQLSCNILDFT